MIRFFVNNHSGRCRKWLLCRPKYIYSFYYQFRKIFKSFYILMKENNQKSKQQQHSAHRAPITNIAQYSFTNYLYGLRVYHGWHRSSNHHADFLCLLSEFSVYYFLKRSRLTMKTSQITCLWNILYYLATRAA